MKISQVTTETLANYLRIDDVSLEEIAELEVMRTSAVEYIKAYTGLTDEQIEAHEDITQALFVLVADMFDNRNLYIEGKASNVNKSVQCILGMHSVNLL